MGVVKEVRFGLDGKRTTDGYAIGINFAWSHPVIFIEKEETYSLATIGHELVHIHGQHHMQKAALMVASSIAMITAINKPFALLATLFFKETLEVGLDRWQEKQADLKAAEILEPKEIASYIRHFQEIANAYKIYYRNAEKAPMYIKWRVRLMISPEGNHRLNLHTFPYLIDRHPPYTTRIAYLKDCISKKP